MSWYFYCQVALIWIFSLLNPNRSPAQRVAAESEEKARPAYEKALRPFRRLRAFSELVRLKGFEPPTYWFVASHSIQLSYSRVPNKKYYIILNSKSQVKNEAIKKRTP